MQQKKIDPSRPTDIVHQYNERTKTSELMAPSRTNIIGLEKEILYTAAQQKIYIQGHLVKTAAGYL